MSLITSREEGVHGLCGAVTKSLSKVCTLHRQYSTVLSRQSRMSIFGTVWGASETCTEPSDDLYYSSTTSTVDRESRGESPNPDGGAAGKSYSGSGGGRRSVTLEGSTLDTSCGADSPVIAPSEKDLGLSMELSACIIKDLMSFIGTVKDEMDKEHEVGETRRGEENTQEEERDVNEILKQSFSRRLYCTGHAGRPPPLGTGARTGGCLLDHFIAPLERCPMADAARLLELKDRTTVRIVRAIMEKGTAATVLETVKILRSTFGHGSGNILLPIPPHQVRQTSTHLQARRLCVIISHFRSYVCTQLYTDAP
jgi:hypothetical protein